MKEKKITIKVDGEGLIKCPYCKARLNDVFYLWTCRNCSRNFIELLKKWEEVQNK